MTEREIAKSVARERFWNLLLWSAYCFAILSAIIYLLAAEVVPNLRDQAAPGQMLAGCFFCAVLFLGGAFCLFSALDYLSISRNPHKLTKFINGDYLELPDYDD